MIYSSEQSSRRALEQQSANRARETGTEATFAARADHDLPETLSSPDRQWAVSYARLAREVGLDEDIQLAFQAVARVLNPILQGKVGENARWNHKCRRGRNCLRSSTGRRSIPLSPVVVECSSAALPLARRNNP